MPGGFSRRMMQRAVELLDEQAGFCQICRRAHRPDYAHHRDDPEYRRWFYQQNGRWPTWNDAMAHCHPDVQSGLRMWLKRAGQDLDERAQPLPDVEVTKEPHSPE